MIPSGACELSEIAQMARRSQGLDRFTILSDARALAVARSSTSSSPCGLFAKAVLCPRFISQIAGGHRSIISSLFYTSHTRSTDRKTAAPFRCLHLNLQASSHQILYVVLYRAVIAFIGTVLVLAAFILLLLSVQCAPVDLA